MYFDWLKAVPSYWDSLFRNTFLAQNPFTKLKHIPETYSQR